MTEEAPHRCCPRCASDWRDRADRIVSDVRREGLFYCILGISSVAASGVGIYFMFGNSPLSGLAFMGFFYAIIIFFSTMKVYPCIRGGFLVGLEQSYDTMPIVDKTNRTIESAVEKLEKNAGEIASDIRSIRDDIKSQTKPIPVNRRKPVEEVATDGKPG